MPLKVMSKRCDQCLYGANKIVSDARRKEILRQVSRGGGHFICHKASLVDDEAVCAGDWEARGGGQMGRIAGRLGAIKYVTQDDFKS